MRGCRLRSRSPCPVPCWRSPPSSCCSSATAWAAADDPPTAGAGGPYTISEGSDLTLSGSGVDPDGLPVTYAWDVDGDGAYDDAVGANPVVSAATLASLGLGDGPDSAQVRVRVSDGVLETTSAPTTLSVSNVAPTATVGNNGPIDEGAPAVVSVVIRPTRPLPT